MVLTALLSFAVATYILDQVLQKMFLGEIDPIYSDYLSDYPEFTVDKTKNEMIDNVFTQYTLMLGDFELLSNKQISEANQVSKNLLYIYFVLATFLTQVVFLNVLVAVLGESYSEKWAQKELYALQQQTNIFSDYITMIITSLPKKNFLYVVQPVDSKEETVTELSQVKTAVLEAVEELRSANENH